MSHDDKSLVKLAEQQVAESNNEPETGPNGPFSVRPVQTKSSVELTRKEFSYRASKGFLTDPESLREYEEVHSGLAKEIVAHMFALQKNEQGHRHGMELKMAELESRGLDIEAKDRDSQHKHAYIGQCLAFCIAIVFGAIGAILALNGKTTVGCVVFSATLLSLVSVFALGKKTENKEATKQISQEQQAAPQPSVSQDGPTKALNGKN